MGLMSEFKEFAVKGNAMDLAVGVIIGAAFGKIVASLVNDVIMPAVGFIVGGVNFSDLAVVSNIDSPVTMVGIMQGRSKSGRDAALGRPNTEGALDLQGWVNPLFATEARARCGSIRPAASSTMGLDGDAAAVRHGIPSVDHQVHDDLFHLGAFHHPVHLFIHHEIIPRRTGKQQYHK